MVHEHPRTDVHGGCELPQRELDQSALQQVVGGSDDDRLTVLEVDGKLADLARSRLGLGDVPGMRIRVGDARLTLRDERTDSAPVIVGDAFGGRVVPWHLTTREFLADVRRVLRPDGVYAMNVLITCLPGGATDGSVRLGMTMSM